MTQKILLLLLVYAVFIMYDRPRRKNQSGRARFVYGLLMVASLYPGLAFVLDQPWPNLDELVKFFWENPAKRFVEAVKLPSGD